MSKLKLALFERDDNSTFRVCPDCAEVLEQQGMVKRVTEHEGLALFKIAPGVSEEDCREFVKGRHDH